MTPLRDRISPDSIKRRGIERINLLRFLYAFISNCRNFDREHYIAQKTPSMLDLMVCYTDLYGVEPRNTCADVFLTAVVGLVGSVV